MTSSKHVFPSVFDALARREGQKVTLPTLVSLTGFSENQVRSSIANARRVNEVFARQIQVVKLGRVWRFVASAEGNNYPSVQEIENEVAVGAPHIWKHVLASLTRNAGIIMSKERLAEDASSENLTVTADQVARAMMTIMRQPIINQKIEVIRAGANWRYVGDKVTPVPKKKETYVSPSIRSSLIRYFWQNIGRVVMIDEIMRDLGFTHKQVQNGMYALTLSDDSYVIVQRGNSWQYNADSDPDPTPTPTPVETNGHTPNALDAVPSQSYTPEAATTYPASSTVSSIPLAQPRPQVVATATATAQGGRLFEEIGQTSAGAILVKEAESGAIYRATPLA